MHLQESGEMYLETIHILSQRGKGVRAVDVAEYMGFSKPSVSRAVGLLRTGGYLELDANGFLVLTDEGIVEQGSHAQLMAKKGVYYSLYSMYQDR